MPRLERFTFLVDPSERQIITYLAQKLQRSQSDAVRFVVFQAANRFMAEDEWAKMRGYQKKTEPVTQERST